MVAFTKAELPNSITSVEGLMIWGAGVLQAVHSNEVYKENDLATGAYPKATLPRFQSVDSGIVVVCRVGIRQALNADAINAKGWEPTKIIEWGQGLSIPPEFTS